MSDSKCKSNVVFHRLCSEYHSGTGIPIGGRQLQQWVGCNFGIINYSSIFLSVYRFPPISKVYVSIPLPSASASTIHHASTFRCAPLVWLVVALPSASTPILSQLPSPPPLVDLLLVTAFGIVSRRSHRRIHPVRRHLPQSGRPPHIAISVAVVVRIRHQRRASFAVAVAAGNLAHIRCHRGVSPTIAHCVSPSPGRGPEEGEKSEAMMFVSREHRWSLAKKAKINAKFT